MSLEGALMLKALGSGVRAIGSAVSGAFKPVEAASFEELLSRAQSGNLGESSPVAIDPAAGVTLDDAQLARLAVATDQAAASGADRALIFIDGAALEVDVEARKVTAKLDLDEPGVLEGFGTVIRAGKADGGFVADAPIDLLRGTPPGTIENQSLINLLGG